MSRDKIEAIEDYLLGRIAALEQLVNRYGEGDKDKLPTWRAALLETRLTLKKVRAIVSADAGGHPKRKARK